MTDIDRIEPTLEPMNPAAAPAAPRPETDSPAPQETNNEAEALAQAEIADLKAKNAQLAEQYLRSQAEAQNTRRRAEEEMAKARKFAVEGFAEAMLAVVDSLEAGLAVKEASPEQIREGAEATLSQLKSVLERNKVVQIDPQRGAKFDPHQHQAISMVPADAAQEANTIVSVLQKGYLIADRVLRPALVTVSAPK